jgi:hypothetical protein
VNSGRSRIMRNDMVFLQSDAEEKSDSREAKRHERAAASPRRLSHVDVVARNVAAVGSEQLVCSSVTNAWRVPDLVKVPNKSIDAILTVACAPTGRIYGYRPRPARSQRVVALSQQRVRFCWSARDIGRSCIARGNPGLRKRRPGASIEAAHVTGYDSFPIGHESLVRMRSGSMAAAASRTKWLALRV